jgi:methionyl-tRNA formyltransferase
MNSFKIVFITQEDPFYVRLFFEEFFKHYKPLEDVVGVVIAPAMGKKTLKGLIKQMVDFYGPWDFTRMGFKYTIYKTLDKISQIIPFKRFFSIEQICRNYNIPMMKCRNINSELFLERLRQIDPDLVISVAAPQIFKEKLIGIPRKGCINIHNSRLPKYRGMLPNFWQMYHGEKAVGTTIHRINVGIDDGEILLQKETDILNRESLDSLICRTKKFGARLMVEAIEGVKNNSLNLSPNISSEASYFTFPTKKDVFKFRKKGFRLL